MLNFFDERLTAQNIDVQLFADTVNKSGDVWITTTVDTFLQRKVLRAGISNFATENIHLDKLVEILNFTRKKFLTQA